MRKKPRIGKPTPRQLEEALQLFRDFTGHNPQVVALDMPKPPKVLLRVGYLDGLMYTPTRDGKARKHIHQFSAAARPLLCFDPDAHQLYILGGGYDFTECGIEDRPRKGVSPHVFRPSDSKSRTA